MLRMVRAPSDGVELRFEVHGEGLPVLLVHGFPLSGRMWDGVVERLAGAYRLIVPDLRGHGGSEPSDEATMSDYADDLVAVLDAAGETGPVTVAGMSMGGYVCMELCRRHSERVRALALVDSRADPDTPEAAAGRRAMAKRVLLEGSGVVADDMVSKLFAGSATAEMREGWRARMAATPTSGIAAALLAMADRPDSNPLLREQRKPVLVVVGEEDGITPVEGAREMARASGGTLAVIPGAGHMAAVEKPGAVAAALARFLEVNR